MLVFLMFKLNTTVMVMTMKIKQSISSIIKSLKMCGKICPKYMWAMGFKNFLDSIFPFISIIFSYLILDGLVYGETKELIFTYVGWLIGLNLVVGLLSKLCQYFASKHAASLDYRLSRAISNKSFTLDYEQIEDSEVMELITKAKEGSNSNGGITSLINTFYDTVLNAFLKLVYAIILLVGLVVIKDHNSTLLIVRILNHPASAIIIILALVFVTICTTIIVKKDANAGYQAMLDNIDLNRKYSCIYNVCSDYRYGKDIRLYSMQPMLMDIMSDKRFSVDKSWRAYSLKSIRYRSYISLASKVLLIISYLYVGLKAYYGLISIGSVVSYVSAITILGTSINTFFEGYVQMAQSATYLQHYFTYLNLPTKMKYGNQSLHDHDIEIEFKDVSFSYPKQDELILSHINLKINKGCKVAIVGQNGAGKTTLIKLLCRLYEPTSGEILINGLSIKEFSREELYKIFSIVFQDFKLFSYSIKDNVASGTVPDETKVWDSLEKAGISNRVKQMDKGLDTILYQRNEENGVEISGGEAQKISLARALYKDAPMVILDEPTSALDPLAEADIYERFKNMINGKTAIFISHRMSSCKFCDQIVVLENGKIEEIGTHQELIKNKRLYHEMWTAQSKYYN